MDEDLMPLTPSDEMVHKLQLKQQAATAVSQADIDARLRRALLRQHQAQQHTYHTGQQVFYWRDVPGSAEPKIRWKGPATIAMVEPGRAGLASNVYWFVHDTTLIRASAEHLRPHLNTPINTTTNSSTTTTTRAQQALDNIRNRSTTLYLDRHISNKRKRTEVTTEDESEDDPPPTVAVPMDSPSTHDY